MPKPSSTSRSDQGPASTSNVDEFIKRIEHTLHELQSALITLEEIRTAEDANETDLALTSYQNQWYESAPTSIT